MNTPATTTPTSARLLIGFGARLVIVLALAWLVDASGFGDAGDAQLRQQYYWVRGQRDSSQRVVLVAFDGPTVAAWGPPPWRTEQLAAAVAAIARGKPVAIGIVDDVARVVRSPGPETGVIAGRVALRLDDESVDATMLSVAGEPTVPARILAAARSSDAIDTAGIAVNFVGRRGLPTLSALEVARGNIPGESFAGKIVVFGITAQPYAGLVPTPIGSLAPAQVQAHALSSVIDGAAWSHIPAWWRWSIIVAFAAIAMVLVHHLAPIGAAIATATAVLAILAFDYASFAAATRIGATLPLFATLAAVAIERIHERIVIRRHLHDIAYWTRQWMLLDSMRTDVPADEPAYWRRVGSLARLYLGCTSTIVAELPEGRSHLRLRVIFGTTSNQIGELRRDIRRSPYLKAHLTLGPVWHDRFVPGEATLLVPLVVNTKLLGFWIVNFSDRDVVTAPHMALIKTLAYEIATAIDRHRNHAGPRSRGAVARILGGGRLSFDLDEVRGSLHAHSRNQKDLVMLGESMPFGVFVATLWGEVRYMNTAMRLACKHEGLDPSSDGLAEVLCRLSGFRVEAVHQHLRKLVQELEELHIHGPRHDFVLSWLKPAADDPAPTEQLILVCALPSSGRRSNQAIVPAAKPTDDNAMTIRRTKVDLDLQTLAHGTPTFTASRQPHVPDATLQFRKPVVDERTAPRGIDERSEKTRGGDPTGFGGAGGGTPRGIDERSEKTQGGDPTGFAGGAGGGPRSIAETHDGSGHEDVTFVVTGATERSSRSMSVIPDPMKTLPMFKVEDPS